MRVADEENKGSLLKLNNLSLEDFFEALCRVAVVKALPTEQEVMDQGTSDAGEFLLQMRQVLPGVYEDWVSEWYRTHDGFPTKATQPVHLCVSGLIALIVRSIRVQAANNASVGTLDGPEQKITKKEMRGFGVPGGK